MVHFDENRLAAYCRRHGIVKLRLFGSAVRGEDSSESDVGALATLEKKRSALASVLKAGDGTAE